jgi:transposase
MTYIGIDVSKDSFVAAFPDGHHYLTRTYSNSTSGIRRLIEVLSPGEHHCVMEATGNYCFLLLYMLDEEGIAGSLVNPKQTKHFFRMMLGTTKTDTQDACMLAMYGEKMNPPIYKIPSESLMRIKQKRTVIRQMKKQLRATKNLKSSLMVLPSTDPKSIMALNHTISFLEAEIKSMEKEMADLTENEFSKQLKALMSIKGIGITLATALIVATGGFTYFQNAKQVSRYIGICPTYQQSGTSLNVRGRINKNGDSNLRSMLYLGAWTALQYNAACRECYLRLRGEGKPPKVAVIAVENKLVRQAFAIVKSGTTYIDGFTSARPK